MARHHAKNLLILLRDIKDDCIFSVSADIQSQKLTIIDLLAERSLDQKTLAPYSA